MTHAEGVILRDAVAKIGAHPPGGQPAALVGTERAVPQGGGARAQRARRQPAPRRDRAADRSDRARRSPEQPVPANLNYDMWLGPTPEAYYTEQRVHSQRTLANGEPDIQSRPGWLRNDAYCLGMITGWGAHHFDTAHWGMDMELTGPITHRRAAASSRRTRSGTCTARTTSSSRIPATCMMTVSDKLPNGIKFIGDEGWIFVSRDAQHDGERSDRVADVAQVARRERSAAARSEGAEGRAAAQHVAPQELARVRAVAEAAARARADRASQRTRRAS